jgi:hypothetical protein
MSNNALAFMAGLASGGVRGYQIRRDMDKEDEASALRKEQAERQRTEWAREDKLRTDLGAAAQPQAVTPGEVYQPAVDDDGNAMPANPTAGTFMAGGQRYADEGQALSAAAAANTPEAQNQRMAQAYMANGAPDKALAMQANVRQAKLADLQLTKTQGDMERETAWRDAVTPLAQKGWSALPDVYKRYKDGNDVLVQEDGKGGAAVQFLDKDGKPLGNPQHYASLPEFVDQLSGAFDPKLWTAAAKDQRKEAREAAKDAQTASYQNRTVAVAEQNANTNDAYRSDMVKVAQQNAGTRAGSTVDRMPERDRQAYDTAEAEAKDYRKRILDLQTDPLADPEDPRTQQVLQNLNQQLTESVKRSRIILARNAPPPGAAAAPGADPLGVRSPAPAPSATMAGGRGPDTRVSPEQQKALDANRPAILDQEKVQAQGELVKAKALQAAATAPDQRAEADAAVARIEGDLAALDREIKAASKGKGGAAQAAPAPAPAAAQAAPAPAPAPAAAAPAAPPAPRTPESTAAAAAARVRAAPAPAAMAAPTAPPVVTNPAPAPAPAATMAPKPTADATLNQITEKNAKRKAEQVATYSAELEVAKRALQDAIASRNPQAINKAATLLTQHQQALALVQNS